MALPGIGGFVDGAGEFAKWQIHLELVMSVVLVNCKAIHLTIDVDVVSGKFARRRSRQAGESPCDSPPGWPGHLQWQQPLMPGCELLA